MFWPKNKHKKKWNKLKIEDYLHSNDVDDKIFIFVEVFLAISKGPIFIYLYLVWAKFS